MAVPASLGEGRALSEGWRRAGPRDDWRTDDGVVSALSAPLSGVRPEAVSEQAHIEARFAVDGEVAEDFSDGAGEFEAEESREE